MKTKAEIQKSIDSTKRTIQELWKEYDETTDKNREKTLFALINEYQNDLHILRWVLE